MQNKEKYQQRIWYARIRIHFDLTIDPTQISLACQIPLKSIYYLPFTFFSSKIRKCNKIQSWIRIKRSANPKDGEIENLVTHPLIFTTDPAAVILTGTPLRILASTYSLHGGFAFFASTFGPIATDGLSSRHHQFVREVTGECGDHHHSIVTCCITWPPISSYKARHKQHIAWNNWVYGNFLNKWRRYFPPFLAVFVVVGIPELRPAVVGVG